MSVVEARDRFLAKRTVVVPGDLEGFLSAAIGEVVCYAHVAVDGCVLDCVLVAAIWTPRLVRRRRLRWLAPLARKVYEVRVARA